MTHVRAVILMVLVAFLWSTAGVVTRHLDSSPSFEITFWRSLFCFLTLAVTLTSMYGATLWRNLLRSPKIIWMSGVCWSFMFTAFMVAITVTSVANVLIVMALGPLITAIFARLFLKHKLQNVTWLAIWIAGFGIVWMFINEGDATMSLVGSLISFTVPLGYATNFTLLQHVGLDKNTAVNDNSDEPVTDMILAVMIGAFISTLVTFPLSFPFQTSLHDLSLLSLLGIFQLAVPCLLVVRLSRVLSAPEISLLAQLEVIFGVTWAWLWAGEHLSISSLFGGAMVIGALAINELARMCHQQKKENDATIVPETR